MAFSSSLAPQCAWMFLFPAENEYRKVFKKSILHCPLKKYSWKLYFAWTAGKLVLQTLNSAIVCVTAFNPNIIVGCMASFALGRPCFKTGAVMMIFPDRNDDSDPLRA